MQDIKRRDFVKGAGAMAGTALAVGAMTSVAQAVEATTSYNGEIAVPSFLVAPDPITDISETLDYDIVVIGAGTAGVPAAWVAFENGAKVALLQKESVAISQGGTATGVDVEASDPEGLAAMVSLIQAGNAYRSPREIIEAWVQNSGEAMNWIIDKAGQYCSFHNASSPTAEFNGKTVTYVRNSFSNKPYANGEAYIELADAAAAEGLEIFYETPGVQLVQDESGAVTGVIAQDAEGKYIQFNAAKGVIVATGDYQNDPEMCAYYLPELQYMDRKQFNKTGDGHKMVLWAGGKIEDVCHTKMLHDFDGGPGGMADIPYLAVKDNGKRFTDESVEMSLYNNFLRGPHDCGWYSQIFDADYVAVGTEWGMHPTDEEALKNFMPEEEGEKTGVYEGLINTYKADTLEELAEKIGITDVEQFLATVENYNAMCEAGSDTEMGKPAQYLAPVVNPPFYGIHRHVRVSAICAGVEVDAELHCLTPEGEVIPGLYAVGNTARFYGGVDYPLDVAGLSIGRAITQGYMVGKALSTQ